MFARLTLLMLTAILSDNYPPAVPPGSESGVPENDVKVVSCPSCGEETDVKSGSRYWCQCSGWFTPKKRREA